MSITGISGGPMVQFWVVDRGDTLMKGNFFGGLIGKLAPMGEVEESFRRGGYGKGLANKPGGKGTKFPGDLFLWIWADSW